MKRNIYLWSISICIFLNVPVMAQYCGGSGPSVCTPGNETVFGLYPPDTALPCAIEGVPYSQVITFVTPASEDGYTLENLTLAAINNLPCGLCWASNSSSNQISGGSSGCLRVSGTTKDAPGQYELIVYASATVSVPVIGNVTVGPLNIDSLAGLKYFGRVQIPGGNCAPVNPNSNGLTASVPGSIATPTITGNSTVCVGGSTTLSVTGANYYAYIWSDGEITSSATATAAGTYTVTVYDNCNTATATKTLTSAPAPTASVTPTSETVCAGSLVTLTASGGGTYRWSAGSTAASIDVVPSETKTYTVTVTGSNSCTASAASTLTVGAGATATISPAGIAICGGTDTTLTASGGTSYLWSNSATTASISVAPSNTTTYTVTASNGNCSATASSTVDIITLQPVVSANGPVSICSGGTVGLSVANNYTSYLWSTGATTQSITATETGAYSCTVTNASGCTGSSNVVNVTISNGNLTPVVTASNSFKLCPGGVTTLDAGSGYTTYSWNVGVGTETIEVSNTITGNYTYTVTVTQGACSGTATATVVVADSPAVVNVSPPGPVDVCAGSPVMLDAGAGYSSYAWSNNQTTETIQPIATGTYYVTVTQNNACTGTGGVSVSFTQVPAVSIQPADSQSICFGQTLTLTAGAGYDSYSWNTGDSTQIIEVSNSGDYSVVAGKNGCRVESDTVYATIQPQVSPAITPTGNQSVCSGQNTTLSADATYDSYLWSNGSTSQSITADSAGVYNLSVTLNGCPGSVSTATTITVNPTPVATLVESISDSAYAVLQAGPANATYQWQMQLTPTGPDSILPNIQQYDTAYCGAGGLYYTVIATLNGCNSTSAQVEATCSSSTTNIPGISSLTSFGIQPNPASDLLTIAYDLNETAHVQIAILDITGRKALDVKNESENTGSYHLQVNINALPAGIYLVNFMTDKGSLNSKFVKE